MSYPPPLARIETRICPDAGVIFFMFQKGLGQATELARIAKSLDTLSNPRFSLFERPSGRLRSVTKTPIKQGFFVNFMPDRLQRYQILSPDERNPKGTFWREKVQDTVVVRLNRVFSTGCRKATALQTVRWRRK